MKIKTKLSLGLGFLFSVILLLAGLGTYYTIRLAGEAKEVLKNNYESLENAKNMLRATDALLLSDSASYLLALKTFETSLQRQLNNITEIGEQGATFTIKENFDLLKETLTAKKEQGATNHQIAVIRQHLYQLTDINLQAIIRKSQAAQNAAERVSMYLILIGSFSTLITFAFILYFPGYIANPVRELTESIKQIANRNYRQRLHFKAGNEFGELADSFNQMAQKLDEYEHSNLAQIMFEKRRIEAIINNMSDAIIGLDENRTILFSNHEATLLLGLTEADLVGKYAPDVALQNDLLRHLLSENGTSPIKIGSPEKESYFAKEVVAIQLPPTEAGKKIGQVIILKNITQFRELDLAKTNFIATISHELKTPISSVKLSLKLLRDERIGSLNPEQQRLLEYISEDSERLLRITGELLNLAQVETGNIQLHYRPIHPKEIINYACQTIQLQAAQKQVNLEVNLSEDLPPVHTDLEKTAWVLVNFLSNAIRFSSQAGTIYIRASYTTSQGKQFVCFSVQDFGRGIEARYKDRIFDKFFQIPDADALKGGTGLGLAISKEFITAQGGDIWVESQLGAGSTFSFSLPVV
ncbi:PAS domain-containing sensor histidine kinase [Adhaeribacter aerolatus]|uniref:histidine kinase n=1 Tax=Adhaeribacter aerolatus TaxID=670289 RepID=A0A512B1C6_9BACT|nr:ATP-binding protein [Adhaeribacter aerolatus]GEO05743.1 PAS domain-containing sensor histidine kinase [Adhaeribacter aerolatus]